MAARSERDATEQKDKAEQAREEADTQRLLAEVQTRLAEHSLARTHVQQGIRLLGEGQASLALAFFSAALRRDPEDPVARAHVLDLLATMGRPRSVSPLEHGGPVRSVAFSPDGRRVVTASQNNRAQVWDAETGAKVGPALRHGDDVRTAAFSPDGRRVVTRSAASRQLPLV